MNEKEFFDLLDKIAEVHDTAPVLVNFAKYYLSKLKSGKSQMMVWEKNRVDVCASVAFTMDPTKIGVYEITKVTRLGNGEYDAEFIRVDQIELNKIYK